LDTYALGKEEREGDLCGAFPASQGRKIKGDARKKIGKESTFRIEEKEGVLKKSVPNG